MPARVRVKASSVESGPVATCLDSRVETCHPVRSTEGLATLSACRVIRTSIRDVDRTSDTSI